MKCACNEIVWNFQKFVGGYFPKRQFKNCFSAVSSLLIWKARPGIYYRLIRSHAICIHQIRNCVIFASNQNWCLPLIRVNKETKQKTRENSPKLWKIYCFFIFFRLHHSERILIINDRGKKNKIVYEIAAAVCTVEIFWLETLLGSHKLHTFSHSKTNIFIW